MPIYEYKCRNGHITERIEPMGKDRAIYCPDCSEMAVRIISIPCKPVIKMSIHFDSGLPQEYISHAKTPEVFERNLSRQGKKIDPEDM